MPIYATWKFAMTMVVALCLMAMLVEPSGFAKGQQSNPPTAPAASQSPAAPPAKEKGSGHRRSKWLMIGVAVAGGVAAAILIKNRKKPEPVVTVGGPTIGIPQ